jgi:dethiobiotin synthetase/adenosylmethionine--8-amino-7-oxononanoate aminotransferase
MTQSDPQTETPGYASSIALDFLTTLRSSTPLLPLSTDDHPTYSPSSTPLPFHIHSRPLGDVLYFITSLWTERGTVRAMEGALMDGLTKRAGMV